MEGHDAAPADGKIERNGEAAEMLRNQELERNADQRRCPDEDQQPIGYRNIAQDGQKRGVGAGDEQEDRRLIDAGQPGFQGPCRAQVERHGGAEQDHERDNIDRKRNGLIGGGLRDGDGQQDRTGNECHHEPDAMHDGVGDQFPEGEGTAAAQDICPGVAAQFGAHAGFSFAVHPAKTSARFGQNGER